MNLSAPYIRRPIMTTMVMAAVFIMGAVSYCKLPISDMPNVDYPTITVSASYPGMAPEIMANNIAQPLEQQFMAIAGLASITSENGVGTSNIVLQFDLDKNMSEAGQDVEAAITRAMSDLPQDLPEEPTYRKINPADSPILYIAMSSSLIPPAELYNWANNYVGQHLSMLNGVAQVMTYGSPYAVRIQVDPSILASSGLTLTEVANALREGSTNLPSGLTDGPSRSAQIFVDGQLSRGSAYDPLIVAYRGGAPVRIRDIGRAVDSLEDDRMSIRYVDKEKNEATVVLAVQRQPGSNTVEISDKIMALLPTLADDLPAAINIKILYDKAISIREAVQDVELTMIAAFVLVVLVIFLYLGKLADTIIPVIVMPMAIVATFIFMLLLGYTLDNLSLLALTLAIGFIIDDAVVVLESIVRHVEEGMAPWQAAMEGSKQISFTVLSMTLSLVAIFVPLVFMGGVVGKIFQEFSITLAIVVLASGFISLTLTPMLCSRFIPPKEPLKQAGENLSGRINRLSLAWYKPKLHWILENPRYALAGGVLSLLGSFYLLGTLNADFLPDEDIGFMVVYNQGEQGTSSERMREYQNEVIALLQNNPYIDSFVSVAAYPEYRQGVNFINMAPRSRRPKMNQIVRELYPQFATITGLETFIKNVPMINLASGTQSRGDYQYTLQGLDSAKVYSSGAALYEKLRGDPLFQGVASDLEDQTPQLNISINRNLASSLGITAAEIENAFLYGFSGNYVNRILTEINQYDVVLELERSYRHNAKGLEEIYLRSATTNRLVPLSAVATWDEGAGLSSVNHIDQLPAVTIDFSLAAGVSLSSALARLKEYLLETAAPGVNGKTRGAAQTFEESVESSGYLLVMALFAIYIILGILYESFIHPLTVMSTLPPAIFGGLATLLVFGMPLSLYSYLGIILLIGIVKKNGIMIVDYALDNIRHKGESPRDAIFDACLVRFRPIMMTSAAAIFGALPIALGIGPGAEARKPLGLVIIGGLLFSQLLTLFLTPVIYLYMEKLNERFSFKGLSSKKAEN